MFSMFETSAVRSCDAVGVAVLDISTCRQARPRVIKVILCFPSQQESAIVNTVEVMNLCRFFRRAAWRGFRIRRACTNPVPTQPSSRLGHEKDFFALRWISNTTNPEQKRK